ncbi:MAG: penicillin-binding protein 2 [Pseudomonadota bacterium]
MKRADSDKTIDKRALVVGLLLSFWFGLVGVRAVYLQAFHDDWLSEKASSQYEKTYQQMGKRGTIYDRNLREMAVSIDAMSIAARPRQIKDVAKTATALAGILDLDKNAILQRLTSKQRFVWLDRQATPRETNALIANPIEGISFQPEHQRFYPSRTLAAQVVGFAGIDGRGLEGIEFHFDEFLKGDARNCTVLKDALGRGFSPDEADTVVPAGNNLILNIDQAVQYFVEQALAEAVKNAEARSGMAIVMSPKTGAILALAHFPLLNPNAYDDVPREVRRNRAITDPFEPGSTMKMFTAAAAIEHGGMNENDVFFCEEGDYKVGKHTIHDTHSYGSLTLQRIVQVSSNIGATKLAHRMGNEALYRTLTAFGFGEKTGIDCPGESAGSLLPLERWKSIDAAVIAFGQGVSASAVQLIAAVSALANDGVLMKPYIVQAITDSSGGIVKRFSPQIVRQAVSPATARTVSRILETVTQEGGTGTAAAIESVRVAGKTGTAQKTDETGRYAKGKFNSSFVGFIPAENPQASILVILDEPKKGHYGGTVAAPAFKKIAMELMNYLNTGTERSKEGLTAELGRGVRG